MLEDYKTLAQVAERHRLPERDVVELIARNRVPIELLDSLLDIVQAAGNLDRWGAKAKLKSAIARSIESFVGDEE